MKFERVSTYPDVNLPRRAAKGAAGYDFECAIDTTCPAHSITLIPTGIKCKIDEGCYLQLSLRSSTPKRKWLILANGVGNIDEGYYGPDSAPENEQGHIMFQVYNLRDEPVVIKKHERIGQGIFLHYLITEDDDATGERNGKGFGSTGN